MVETIALADGSAMPRLGQGTWYLGEQPALRAQELAALRTGIERGMTLIDTAEMYGDGRSEELVGEAIRGYEREGLYLVSKVYPHNAGRRGMARACENSLRRLNTAYLDLYLLHWRGRIPLAETADCMEELVRQGKIRRWGVSNLDADDMQELWDTGVGQNCRTDQVLYHVASRGVEYDLLPWLQRHRMAMMAYCPLAQGGSLRAKALRDPTLKDLALEKNCSVSQLMLAFVLHQPGTVAIPRTGNPQHAAENAAAGDIRLTQRDMERLNAAFVPPTSREPLDIL